MAEEAQNTETPVLTKTQESIQKCKDKSYYYWHNSVSNTVPFPKPELLETKAVAVEVGPEHKKISSYSWGEDDDSVSIYVDIKKIREPKDGDEPLTQEHVTWQFGTREVDLKLTNFNSEHHSLKISNLHGDIVAEECKVRVRPARITITLAKTEKSKTWFSLVKK
eukprot:TRINITY_DN23002_c0_g1_i1.p1 TRINITY_DN23002_c0_g1~~TRINITY_DN23002_c0_g1_i1.p1  ORF type:complete len:190 (-),score=18.80 TRINITY_DN23002_c0_g1_i1:186-680(-)